MNAFDGYLQGRPVSAENVRFPDSDTVGNDQGIRGNENLEMTTIYITLAKKQQAIYMQKNAL